MEIRNADAGEADRLAQLWYDGWCDAHLKIVPAELTRVRTPESFRERMRAAIKDVRVAGPAGAPIAFYLLKDDELYQFYVSAGARGTGTPRARKHRYRATDRKRAARARLRASARRRAAGRAWPRRRAR